MALKPISVFVPEHAHRALRLYSFEHDTTMNRVILRAIDKHFPELHVLERTAPPSDDAKPEANHD